MKYKIIWSEKKTTSTGKEKIDATLDDGTRQLDHVTIWSDFPNFAGLMTGHEVEGDVVTKQNGAYTNNTLYPLKPVNASPRASGGFAGGMGKQMMKEKQEGIKESQDRKEHSIKESSSIRDSVQLALAEFNADSTVNLEERIQHWRKWLLDNWELPF